VLSNRGLGAIYLLAIVALSSATAKFEWVSPIETPEGPWDWYREVGVRNGIVVIARHEPPGGGWSFGFDWPRAIPVPLFAGAGPESGGLYAAPWFVLGTLAVAHFWIRARRRVPPARTPRPGPQF
jgi:hypothetical protein